MKPIVTLFVIVGVLIVMWGAAANHNAKPESETVYWYNFGASLKETVEVIGQPDSTERLSGSIQTYKWHEPCLALTFQDDKLSTATWYAKQN